MSTLPDDELYLRGIETLVASWMAVASVAAHAAVQRHPGVTAAVFPIGPEREFYNNAVLDQGLTRAGMGEALDAMQSAYAEAGVPHFAAWVHESDHALRAEIEGRGFTIEESTVAMGVDLAEIRLARPTIDIVEPDWSSYRRIFLPPGLLADIHKTGFRLQLAQLDNDVVAAAVSFDHVGDCGIYNVETLEPFRRRGVGTALTTLLLLEARRRGCKTASLQSSAMAERVYTAVGFRSLGTILEYAPPH